VPPKSADTHDHRSLPKEALRPPSHKHVHSHANGPPNIGHVYCHAHPSFPAMACMVAFGAGPGTRRERRGRESRVPCLPQCRHATRIPRLRYAAAGGSWKSPSGPRGAGRTSATASQFRSPQMWGTPTCFRVCHQPSLSISSGSKPNQVGMAGSSKTTGAVTFDSAIFRRTNGARTFCKMHWR